LNSELQAGIYMLKGILSELPEEERKAIEAATAEVKAIAAKYGDVGTLAIAVLALEAIEKLTS
jgi:hypothetical protein